MENVTSSPDLGQLRGYYDYLESAAFLPFAAADLARANGRLMQSVTSVAQNVAAVSVVGGWGGGRQSPWQGTYRGSTLRGGSCARQGEVAGRRDHGGFAGKLKGREAGDTDRAVGDDLWSVGAAGVEGAAGRGAGGVAGFCCHGVR